MSVAHSSSHYSVKISMEPCTTEQQREWRRDSERKVEGDTRKLALQGVEVDDAIGASALERLVENVPNHRLHLNFVDVGEQESERHKDLDNVRRIAVGEVHDG